MTENEGHRERLVNEFCVAWATRNVETLIPYLSPNVEYHIFEGGPVINGVEAFREQIGKFLSGMREVRWEITRSTVMGDIVLNERVDHFLRPPAARSQICTFTSWECLSCATARSSTGRIINSATSAKRE